jgi:CDP-paratose 2-epimerase
MKICVTGSLGLVGLSTCKYYLEKGNTVVGVDNNMRETLFGKQGKTENKQDMLSMYPNYIHKILDIRDRDGINNLFNEYKFDVIIHTASQPSHDKAKDIPLLDFEINALGTLNLLEASRKYCPDPVFIFTSTNKVYGDNPNKVKLVELKDKFDFEDKEFKGFDETTNIDSCIHSFMGSSKLAADAYVQEYGKNLGMKTAVLRLGCITGANHSGVKLHGFMSFLVKSLIKGETYEIIGYKGKQVRDQIHADDLVRVMDEIVKKPVNGEVFNMGGGRENSASILELIDTISKKANLKCKVKYNEVPRVGDHICYITNFEKFQKFYPDWKLTKNLDDIIEDLLSYEKMEIEA